MKWILVWWIICPGHPQKMHIEYYPNELACQRAVSFIQVPPGRELRARCSKE